MLGAIFKEPTLASVSALVIFALFIAALNDFGAGIMLLFHNGFKKTFDAVKTKDGKLFMLSGVIAGPIAMSCYVLAMQQLSAVHALVLTSMFPIVSVALGVIFKHEVFSKTKLIALGLAILGIVSLGLEGSTEGSTFIGVLLAIVCMVGWGIEGFLVKKATGDTVDPKDAITIRELTSGLSYVIILSLLFRSEFFEMFSVEMPAKIGVVLILAMTSAAISYLCWYKSIATIGIAKADTLNITYGLWGIVLTWLVTGFTGISIYITASAALIFVASALVIRDKAE